MIISEKLYENKYIYKNKKQRSCCKSKTLCGFTNNMGNRIFINNKNKIKIFENSIKKPKKTKKFDSVKISRKYFSDKKKIENKKAKECEKYLKEYFVSYNKKTKEIFKNQKNELNSKALKNIFKTENIKINKNN